MIIIILKNNHTILGEMHVIMQIKHFDFTMQAYACIHHHNWFSESAKSLNLHGIGHMLLFHLIYITCDMRIDKILDHMWHVHLVSYMHACMRNFTNL